MVIQFAATTSVRPSEDLDATILGLKLVNFADIHEGKLNPDFLIDIVGQIVSIGEVEILNVNKKQTKRLTMTLRDTSDVRLNCVLWGNYAESLESVATHATNATICFVLRFGKLRLYQGVWSIGNCYSSSIVMTDPDLPEINSFRNRLPKDDVTLSYTHPNQLTIVNSVSVRDDFFLHTPRRTISEILGASEVEKCVTMATIMSIDTEFGWYYMSCKVCSKKVLPLDMDLLKEQYPGRPFPKQLWKCGKCKDDVESVVPAFMQTFRVMDNIGETKFLIFDKLAMEVVNQTAAQLTESVEEIQDPDVLPLPISNICGKTYLFKLSIESSNIVFNSDVYKVTKIVTQSDMVKEFSEISGFLTTPDVKSDEKGFITPDEQVPKMLFDSGDDDNSPQSKRKSDEMIDFDDHNGEQSTSKKAANGDMKALASEQKISLKPVKKEKVDD
ncbi:hypothetical protein EUTSA_v10028256mg [Eutrema salsugineum]|uniref:Replication factor A C-terminal domain-containing protein n=1 Tax=Eutrema salsugineum TaxID=72664 RepID=V4LAA2_EUTSA|nr:hypothetical protein EUTSA_v10028256mg [Eutrema salsugineum]